MGDTTVMRAKATGIIKGEPGAPRTIVTKGKSTAHAGHPIVAGHPHLWEPIRVDYPVGGDLVLVADAADAADLSHTEAIRTLLVGLVDRGYSLPDPATVPSDEVADMVVRIALNNLPDAGPAVNEADVAAHPVAGDLRRTEGGQLQEWGDGMWHDVQEGPVATEPGCTHPDCTLDHPHPGPAVLPTGPDPDPISTPHGPVDALGNDWDDRDRAAANGDAEATMPVDEPAPPADEPADETTKEGRTAIRDWAGEHGYDVHPAGRIPQDVIDAYHADRG